MAVADPVVMPLAEEMLECLAQEIAKVESPPRWVQIRPGTVVDQLLSTSDDECCSGLAWVRPALVVPSSTTFPVQDSAPMKDGTRSWAITFELGAFRCAPTPGPNDIPSGADWHAATQAVMDDAAALRRAICCFTDRDRARRGRVLPGAWDPIQVQGGCVGGTMSVTVQGPACDCADAGPASS